jgi:hypothetical protein
MICFSQIVMGFQINNMPNKKTPPLLFMLCLMNMMLNAQTLPQSQTRLFLIAGQSNAVGMGDSSQSVTCKPETAFEYRFLSHNLVPLKDPTGIHELDFQVANTGSIAPALAERYHEISGKKVVIVAAAKGGSSCHRKAELKDNGTWDTAGNLTLFEKAVEKTQKAMQKTDLPLSGIIWLQGERDANAINENKLTQEAYETALENLIVRFRKALGQHLPFYIVLTGYYTDHPTAGFDTVRETQQKVAGKLKNVFVVYRDTKTFKEKGWMKDLIHYNQTGLNEIGRKVADEIQKLEN